MALNLSRLRVNRHDTVLDPFPAPTLRYCIIRMCASAESSKKLIVTTYGLAGLAHEHHDGWVRQCHMPLASTCSLESTSNLERVLAVIAEASPSLRAHFGTSGRSRSLYSHLASFY